MTDTCPIPTCRGCTPTSAPDPERRSSFLKAVITAKRSLDHFVRLQDQPLRNSPPDRLRGLEIDYALDLRRLLDGQVPGLRALEDLVCVGGCPIIMFRVVMSVSHQCAGLYGYPRPEHRGQAVLRGEPRDRARLRCEERVRQYNHRPRALPRHRGEGGLNLARGACFNR